jgi:hypothetical protein
MHEDITRMLSHSHGFAAVGSDGTLGIVETPVFPPSSSRADFLIVRTQRPGCRSRRPLISVALVESVDPAARVVRFQGTVQELEHLPESLPLASLLRPSWR